MQSESSKINCTFLRGTRREIGHIYFSISFNNANIALFLPFELTPIHKSYAAAVDSLFNSIDFPIAFHLLLNSCPFNEKLHNDRPTHIH